MGKALVTHEHPWSHVVQDVVACIHNSRAPSVRQKTGESTEVKGPDNLTHIVTNKRSFNCTSSNRNEINEILKSRV